MAEFRERFRKPEIRFSGRKNSSQQDVNYDFYELSVKEFAGTAGVCAALLLLLSYTFYDAWVPAAVLFIPVLAVTVKQRQKTLAERRKEKLKRQFLSAGALLGDCLRSGYSVENAVMHSVKDLADLWGPRADIVREWQLLSGKLRLNQTIEEAFGNFAERSGIEQIRDFSEIFRLVKRSGGQLGVIIGSVTTLLSEQFHVDGQIRTMTASRRYEQKIMNIMPAAIILYIRISSPELIQVMYETLIGRAVMSAGLLVYLAAVFWAEKLIDIEM